MYRFRGFGGKEEGAGAAYQSMFCDSGVKGHLSILVDVDPSGWQKVKQRGKVDQVQK